MVNLTRVAPNVKLQRFNSSGCLKLPEYEYSQSELRCKNLRFCNLFLGTRKCIDLPTDVYSLEFKCTKRRTASEGKYFYGMILQKYGLSC